MFFANIINPNRPNEILFYPFDDMSVASQVRGDQREAIIREKIAEKQRELEELRGKREERKKNADESTKILIDME